MEFGAEISQKIKKTIKKQLQTLGCYVDDELPEYIMVMIANKRTKEQMVDDLNLFLNDEAEKFVSWLTVVLSRIQKAMELPDIDVLAEDIGNIHDSKKKMKKGKKDWKTSDSEENIKNEKLEKKKNEEKRRGKESNDKVVEEEREKRRKEHTDRQKEKDAKEYERKEKEHKQKMDERLRREAEREEEANKHRLEREEEISKRRAAREKRDREERERQHERRKKEREMDEKEREEKQRKHRELKKRHDSQRSEEKECFDVFDKKKSIGSIDGERNEIDDDARREVGHGSKRTENWPKKNPMEYVKQIAKDISDQLTSNQHSNLPCKNTEGESDSYRNESGSKTSVEYESKKDHNDNADITLRENVSLQAVSQYEDGENEIEKSDNRSQHKSKAEKYECKSGSRSRSKSRSRHQKDDQSKAHSADKGQRSRSNSRSRERHDRRPHDTKKRSSSRKDDHISNKFDSRQKNKVEEGSQRKRKHDSQGVDASDLHKRRDKSASPRKRNDHSHQSHRSSNEPADKKYGKDTAEALGDHEEVPSKPNMSSQVQVFTDFKRKPSLSKHHQASSALLKRAVTEVVNEKPEGEENGDDVELDYNETNDENDELSDETSNDVVIERRRVINFNEEISGLATITVNFNENKSCNRDNEKQHTVRLNEKDQNKGISNEGRHCGSKHGSVHSRRLSDGKDHHRRKEFLQGISKYDARYTILKSRMEQEGPSSGGKVHHEKTHEKLGNREKSLSSMVADLEEKSRKMKKRSGWRSSHGSSNKHKEGQRVSSRRQHGMGDGDSSAEDEEKRHQHVRALKEEAFRIEMKELARSGQSDEGDLRDLLVGKRDGGKSSSEEEDPLTHRLREKIKEKKHKILFGKLKPEERDISKREREDLVEQLTKTKRRKLTEAKDSPEWIEKLPEKNGVSKDTNACDTNAERNIYIENVTDCEEEEVEEEKEEGDEEQEKMKENPSTDWASNDEEDKQSLETMVHGVADEIHDNIKLNDESRGADKNSLYQCHPIHQDDLEEVSDEELESEREVDEAVNKSIGIEMEEEFTEETGDNIREEFENMEEKNDVSDFVEENVEEEVEVVEIEVEVSDNDNLDGEDQEQDLQNGRKEMGTCKEEERNDIIDILDDDKDVSPEVLKNSMHMESSGDSPLLDEKIDETDKDGTNDLKNMDKYDRRSKQKSSRRRRMRHEFIVTLDGLGDGKRLSIKTGGREKSPKVRRLPEKQKHDRQRRHRHMSRSQSDEEFEEILRRKEEEEKQSIEHSRISEGRKSHRSRSQPSSDKDSKNRELRVNREIMLAENKLKTQKVFKKSLETVQNVTNKLTVNNVANSLDQGTHKTAFINPNFQPKLPIETMNAAVALIPAKIAFNDSTIKVITPTPLNPKPICNLNASEKILLPPTVLAPAPEKLLVTPLCIERSKDFMLPTGTLDIVALPHVGISSLKKKNSKPSIENPPANKAAVPLSSKETSLSATASSQSTAVGINVPVSSAAMPTTVISEESRPTVISTKATIQERCAFWPECKNQSCPYIHPSVNCKLFPNCSYGQHCIYIHPPCMFGDSCSNATCPFMHVHSAPAFSGFSQMCKFYPNCTKADCPFKHLPKPCHYGASCNNPECLFTHDDVHTSLPTPLLKWVAEKPHISERKYAADESLASHIPVSIVTSNG